MADDSRRTTSRRFGGATLVALVAALACLALAGAANAHQISANYDTVVRSITPPTPGLSATVAKKKGRVVLVNRSGKDVIVYGYDHDPYARLDAGGRVFVNLRSPANYLNQDIYADVAVPDFANAGATPKWKLVATNGTYDWHDHRIHWMSPEPPVAVVDLKERTKIFDWRVPLRVGDERGGINGTLYWAGSPAAPPLASIAVFAISAIVVLVGAAVWIRRTREFDADPADADDSPRKESW